MAPPKDIARSYPKRGITADVGFRSEPTFVSEGSPFFDGSASITLDGMTPATFSTAYSFAFWYKDSDTSWYRPLGIRNSTTKDRIGLWFRSGTFAQVLINQANTGDTLYDLVNGSTPVYRDGQWRHFAITVSASQTLKFYLDGVLVVTHTGVKNTNLSAADQAAFGSEYDGSAGIEGNYCKFTWYNAELTQDQVRKLMRSPDYATASQIATLAYYYELAENANDSTGNQNGTNSGAVFGQDYVQLPRGLDLTRGAAQARVQTGRAVQFDGSADHLDAALYSNSSDFFSVSVWIKPDTLKNQNIVTSGNTGDNAFLIFLLSTGVVLVLGNDTSGDYQVSHQTTLEAGRWYHLAMTVDQSDAANHTIKAYVDGVENTTSKTSSSWVGNSSALEIGARSSNVFFDGAIAGVKVFNSQLTTAQIQELYHNPEQVLPTGVSASNLRRYYPLSDFNDTGGTGGRYFQDIGADGEPAEDQGSATMAFAQPVPCPQLGLQQSATRLRFPTTTNNYVQASISPVGANFTLSYWVQPFSLHLGFLYQSTSGSQQVYTNSSGNIEVYSISGNYVGSETYAAGDWLHVVVTTDGLYVNGVLDNAATGAAGLSESGIRIGANNASPNTSFGFDGIMASVAIWDDAITASEVSALYAQGQGYDPRSDTGNYTSSANLINLWLMDDLTTVVDRAGSSNATVTGSDFTAVSFPENASGSTIVGDFSLKRKGVSVLNFFDDVGDTKAVIPAGACEFSTYPDGGSFSLFFRMQKYGTGTNNCFFQNGGTAATIFASYPTGNNLRSDVSDGTDRIINVIASPLDSEWHHLAGVLTYGSPASFKIYLDGVLVSTTTGTLSAGIPTTLPLTIGSYGNTFEHTGALACMKFYNTSLSDNEIEQIYRSDLRLIKGLANE